ncbi:hypothetical protein CR513_51309, partial [Mucuna pruriens]
MAAQDQPHENLILIKAKKNRILTSREFSCFKEGKQGVDKQYHSTKEPRAETRTGCETCLIRKYNVINYVASNNHVLQLPQYSQVLQIVLVDESGLKPKDFFECV